MKKSIALVTLCANWLYPFTTATAQEDDMEMDTIVIEGARVVDTVLGNIDPEVVLSRAEIAAYGVTDLSELLVELEPMTGGADGPPAILLNGRRISGFKEIRKYPTEALAQVEILSEEAAVKFGFRPNQKVINFTLRQRFHALTTEAELTTPTQGGQVQSELDLSNLRLRGDTRWNLDLVFEHQDELLESDRDIAEDREDSRIGRALLSETQVIDFAGSYSHILPKDIAATYLVALTDSEDIRASSLTNERVRDTLLGEAGFTLNKSTGGSNWTINGNYSHETVDQETGTIGEAPNLITERVSETAEIEGIYFRNLFSVPAGNVTTTLQGGYKTSSLSSSSIRSGEGEENNLSRDELSARINVDIPLLDTSSSIGSFSVNMNAGLDELSDRDTLNAYGLGFSWKPQKKLQIIASSTMEQKAPTIQQLGDPIDSVVNSRVYDFSTGLTVDGVDRIRGGAPDLLDEEVQTLRLNVSYEPFEDKNLKLLATYTDIQTENAISNFPALTPIIEEAFTDRVTRDVDGNLQFINVQPLNFTEVKKKRFRYGLNWSISIKPSKRPEISQDERSVLREVFQRRRGGSSNSQNTNQPPPPSNDGQQNTGSQQPTTSNAAQRQRGGGGGRGGRGRGGGRFGEGRFFVSAYHTVLLEDSVLINEGIRELDLLDGDIIRSKGGSSEHTLTVRSGYSKGPFGSYAKLNWESGSTVYGSEIAQLDFDALTTLDLRVNYSFDRNIKLLAKYPFLDGSRISFGIDNIFDARQDVFGSPGTDVINYHPDILDPLGRTVSLTLRKLTY